MTRGLGEWTKAAGVFAAFAAAAAATFPGPLLGGQALYCRDLAALQYPLFHQIGARLRGGQLPLWFPYEGLGVPLVGKAVAGVFYPLTWLHVVLSTPAAVRLELVVSFGAAGWATWCLGRALGCARWAAWLGALAYVLGGPFVGLAMNFTFLRGAVALPLFLLGLHRGLLGERRGLVLAAAGVGLTVLAGDLQATLATALISLGWVVALAARRDVPFSVPGMVVRTAAAGALGAAISAVQLLPTVRAFLHTDRGAGLDLAEASTWSLHPLRLLDLFLGDGVRWWPGGNFNPVRAELLRVDAFWSPTLFVGTATLIGVVLALRVGPLEERRFDAVLAAIAALLLLFALGRWSPVYLLVFKLVPFWRAFRFPEKWVLYAGLLLAMVSARGWARLGSLRDAVPRRTLAAIAILLVAAVVVLAASGLVLRDAPLGLYLRQLASTAGPGVAISLGMLYLVVGERAAAIRPALRWTLGPLAVAAHLIGINGNVADYCAAPEWMVEAPSQVDQVIEQRYGPALGRYRVNPLVLEPRQLATGAGAESRVGSAAAISLWERQVLYPDFSAESGVEVEARLLPGRPRPLSELMARGEAVSLLPLYGTRFVIMTPEASSQVTAWRTRPMARLQQIGVTIAELEDALPRAYIAAAHPVLHDDEALDAVESPAVLAGHEVVLDAQGAPRSRSAGGSVRITRYLPERVELEADVDAPGWLVLNDAYDAQWGAMVDGQPTEVQRANLLVRAVPLAAGRHQVVYTYRMPLDLKVGAGVSLLALVLAALIALPRPGSRWAEARPA